MMRRMQTRSDSLLEAVTNVVLGFALAIVMQVLLYPLLGISTSLATDGTIAVAFTAMSLVRSYLVRRAFETFNSGPPRSDMHSSPEQDPAHARS